MNNEEIKKLLSERGFNPDKTLLFTVPSYETAIIGISTKGNVIYSLNKMIDYLTEDGQFDKMEAYEYITYNTLNTIDSVTDDDEMRYPIVIHELEKIID